LPGGVNGRTVLALGRRSKYLLIELERGETLVVHLGMSGRLTLVPAATPTEPHEHVAFYLRSGTRLRLRDPRRFGMVLALSTSRLAASPHFAALGIEPLARVSAARRSPRRRPGGGGRSRASSWMPAWSSGGEHLRHRIALPRRHPPHALGLPPLRGALGAPRRGGGRGPLPGHHPGGTTLSDFADGEGNSGYFQVSLAAYGRAGEPCPACGTPIRRIVQSGRSTFYCPRCQR